MNDPLLIENSIIKLCLVFKQINNIKLHVKKKNLDYLYYSNSASSQ